jgi:hypothetical protein
MKSKLGGHTAGTGTEMAFVETEESWQDHKVRVRLPSDSVEDKSSLSGDVITYYLHGGEPDECDHH